MNEAGLTPILAYLALAILSSAAGISLASRAPWRVEAWQAGLPWAAGLLMGAFLMGLAGVLVLALLPGQPAWLHLLVAVILLTLLLLSGRWLGNTRYGAERGRQAHCYLPFLRLLLSAWGAGFVAAVVFLPLAQNDALEYMTVGRILFEARDLSAYPAIHPEYERSGFYGPWTHPPLYVAHLYLANLVQGHADFPGVARGVAPWFLLAAVAGVIALGRLRDGLTGLLAGVTVFSTPLIFLGASSSLIDALPIAAATLLLVFLAGLEPGGRASVWWGMALGFALWTHSQGVLIFLLGLGLIVVGTGLIRWRQWSAAVVLSAGIAVLLGVWPYVRNVVLFGTPVSDNPAVFAYEPLDWAGYFSYGRGLDHVTAILQYGFFKGWFAWESYAGVFWLALASLLVFARRLGVRRFWHGLLWGGAEPRQAVLWTAAWLPAGYFAGLVLAWIVGLDWMIRNERYLLIVMPAVALWAAAGLSVLLSWISQATEDWRRKWRAWGAHVLLAAMILAAAGQWMFVAALYPWSTALQLLREDKGFDGAQDDRPFMDKMLDVRGDTAIARLVAGWVPESGRVLSLQPATMYYSGRRMLSYLDPAMLEVYATRDKAVAAAKLVSMGVTHIHSVEYGLPPRTNSVLHDLLADPAYTTLLGERDGYQLFALKPAEAHPQTAQDLAPETRPWQSLLILRLLGRKSTTGWAHDRKPFEGGQSVATQPLFHRDYSTLLLTGRGLPARILDAADEVRLDGAGEYRLDLGLAGEGYVRVWVWVFDPGGRHLPARPRMVGERVIRPGEPVVWQQRFLVPEGGRYLQVGLEHIGRSSLEIRAAHLVRIH